MAATDELSLLERVLLRIGSAETDDQLQNVVSKFLPPVLLKLSSQQEGVRKKVMELLVHVNKRIKSRPLVQLPVEALLLQYQDPAASTFVTNFTIIYIKLGYPRMPLAKQAELAPCLLNALDGKPQCHQDSLLLLLMPVIGEVKFEGSNYFRLSEKPNLAKLLLDFILDMLLLPYGARPTKSPSGSRPQQQVAQSPASSGQPPPANQGPVCTVPAGMSEYGFRRVCGEGELKAEQLEQIKLGIIKFLSGSDIPDSEKLCHLIVAAADTRFAVAEAADSELKKIARALDWNSPTLTQPLFLVFLGNMAAKQIKQELKRCPANTRIRLKLLPLLCRSRGPALQFPACIQVVFDCLYGQNTNPRLKCMALQFTTIIIHWAATPRLNPVAGVLLSGMLKLIAEEQDSKLKIQAYCTVGRLGQKMPSLVNKDLALVQTFFEALAHEDVEVKEAVREALLSFATAFENLEPAKQTMLAAMLAKSVESPEAMVRFVTVRYIVTAFPSTDAASRLLLLLATTDLKDEVANEAQKALYGFDKGESDEGRPDMPLFADMVAQIKLKIEGKADDISSSAIGAAALPFTPDVFTQILTFTRLCLASEAKASIAAHTARPQPLAATPILGNYIRQLLSSENTASPLRDYFKFLQHLLSVSPVVNPLCFMVELLGCAPVQLAPALKDNFKMVNGLSVSTKRGLREMGSQLFGMLLAYTEEESKFDKTLADLTKSLADKNFETKHGALLTLSYGLERRLFLCQQKKQLTLWPSFRKAIISIVGLIDDNQQMIVASACYAIGEICRRTSLPLLADGSNEDPSKLDVANKLLGIIRNVKLPIKVKEEAAQAVGLLCVGEDFPHRRVIIQNLLDTAKESREVDAHLMVSDTLVTCALGPGGPNSRDLWTVSEEDFSVSPETDLTHVEWLLEQLLDKMVPDLHPASRQASCIWLLAIVKNCHSLKPVACRRAIIQGAFMDLLSDNNDLVQDLASKGLGFVYEASSDEEQKELVQNLLDQLSSGKKAVQKVTGDTKLFAEGQLGQTPTGGNLSTYKELCSLASELNQPDLIYKFMHLANHNNAWNSKLGAAFGFSSIMAKAGEQLEPYLPKLVPRLYRYRFDPNPRIQASMASIWQALVKEQKETVDRFECEIMEDLLTHLTFGQWRVRLSCCNAVSDLLRSRNLLPFEKQVSRLWDTLILVMDDVHEGTRQAASHAALTLSKSIVKICDQGPAKNLIIEALGSILKGLHSNISEVRAVSLSTVSDLVKTAGELLVQHLRVILVALLQAVGEADPASLNTLSLQLSGGNTSAQRAQEILDHARAHAVRGHPAMQTITRLLHYVDVTIFAGCVPDLVDLCGTQVPLGTRVGVAHFVDLVLRQLGAELGPHVGKLIWAMVKGLEDRNAAVRTTYAQTLGHLLHISEQGIAQKVLAKLQKLYFDKQDEATSGAIALVLLTLGQNYSDALKDHIRSQIIPLAFLGMHTASSPDNNLREVWTEVWTESVTWTEAGLKAHLPAVTLMLKEAIESRSWGLKAQAAEAICLVAAKLKDDLPAATRRELGDMLLTALSGRTFAGKEAILTATASFTKSCSTALKEELSQGAADNQGGVILKAMCREAHKEAPQYRCHALVALGDTLQALEVDYFEEVYTMVTPILKKGLTEKDSSESEEEEPGNKSGELRIRLKESCYECLGKAWPPTLETQAKYRLQVLQECVEQLPPSPRSLQVSIIAALKQYVERLHLPPVPMDEEVPDELETILGQLTKALSCALSVSKHPKLRKEALGVLFLLAKRLKDDDRKDQIYNLERNLKKNLDEASRDSQPEIKSRVADIRELFKGL
ncbi:proteasome adapter and scaffold protein ECM29 [Neocloeon triangulifer]|uniref:proteasome adapter and scaffold protein ECM29 n=1 Tax=Neocloeon triangulifer TaxID=2078957 RepID=UPI00286F6944|nr:proteasome adapter and scaffold protein ECM29 [Neocloeon triangulifer]